MKNIVWLIIVALSLSGCTILNMLPNAARDQWYMENSVDLREGLDHLGKIYEGNTRDEVLEAWGEPTKIKRNDVWVYDFEEYFTNSILIKFEDDVVVRRWGSMW